MQRVLISILIITFLGIVTNSQAQQTPPVPPALEEAPASYTDGNKFFFQGITELEFENYESALELLLKAREILGSKPGINYSIAQVYLRTNDLVNAAQYGKMAAEAEPENIFYKLLLAEAYERAGRNQATIDEYNAILELQPANVDILMELARVKTRHGQRLEANRVYDRVLNITGPDLYVYMLRFRNLVNLNMIKDAEEKLDEILEFDSRNISILQMAAQFYMEQDRYDDALEMAERAFEINPADTETIILYSDLLIRDRKWEEAADLVERILLDSRIRDMTKVEMVQYFFGQLTRNPANQPLRNATDTLIDTMIREVPDSGHSHALAADYFMFIQDDDRLLDALKETNRLSPDLDTAWQQRMQILMSMGEYEEVIAIGKEADEVVPDDTFILFFMGTAQLLLNQYEDAVETLRNASTLPANSELRSFILGTLGDAYSSLDDWERAFSSYESSIRAYQNNFTALNNFAYYLSLQEIRLDEALEMATIAVENEPDNAAFLDTLGWVYFKKGEYESALRYIQASVDTGDASAVVLEHLGDVHEALGNLDEAKVWWQRALEKDPEKTHLQSKLN